MSQVIRQNNLFAAEDWKTIYRIFTQSDFKSYDFDTIRQSMVNYMQVNFPEDFNDYIESSEFIAIIDLLAFLGQSLAFRIDLNSRENFLDTAERRESILKLAKLLSYKPSRNQPARGIVKIKSITTSEPITDGEGIDLQNKKVFWNDSANLNWYDQWLRVMNASFDSTNTFGSPVKSDTLQSIPTDIYYMNNLKQFDVVRTFNSNIKGQSRSFEIVNIDISDAKQLKEVEPDPFSPFTMIYRNDGTGNSSANTGWFLYFKEGILESEDFTFDSPLPNRNINIDVDNINEFDVWLQQIDSNGTPILSWDKVPAVSGNNIVYNSLAFNKRNVFTVESRNNDRISIKFPDGNFGNVPVGTYRAWYRSSFGSGEAIAPSDIANKTITVPYVNKENQVYDLTITFDLQYAVTNSQPTESDQNIKFNAIKNYYAQDRMISAEDYNIFPIVKVSDIQKIKSINKTHQGHSRYLDINDPTGTVASVNMLGEDGIIYRQPNNARSTATIVDQDTTGAFNYLNTVRTVIQPMLENKNLQNYFFDTYKKSITDQVNNANAFSLENDSSYNKVTWKTFPDAVESTTGYIYQGSSSKENAFMVYLNPQNNEAKLSYIRPGTKLEFTNENRSSVIWATVISIANDGFMFTADTVGSITLDSAVPNGFKLRTVIPNLRSTLTSGEQSEEFNIEAKMKLNEDFGLGYNFWDSASRKEGWYIIEQENLDLTSNFAYSSKGTTADSSWLLYAHKDPNTNIYSFTVRGLEYIFESDNAVRFFNVKDYKNIDVNTGLVIRDQIVLPKTNKDIDDVNLDRPIKFAVDDGFTEPDGFVNARKIKVSNFDGDEDGMPDNPTAHEKIIPYNKYIVLESYEDFDGYTYYKIAGDSEDQSAIATDYYVSVSPDQPHGYLFGTTGFAEAGDKNPDIVLYRGQTYTFHLNLTGHPFWIRTTLSANNGIGLQNGWSVTSAHNGKQTGTFTFTVPSNAPDDLFYACQFHQAMQGNIKVQDFDENTAKVKFVKAGTSTPYFGFYEGSVTGGEIKEATYQGGYWTTEHNGKTYRAYEGRSYTSTNPLFFQYKHTAPRDHRIDPSISSVIEMVVLQKSYYADLVSWKANQKTISELPPRPTNTDLSLVFNEIEKYKALGDQIVYTPAKFVLLFGDQVEDEKLKATFRCIKTPGATITDNEVKTRVVDAINTFFDINFWEFGDSFFFTELAAYIHTQLKGELASIAIVGKDDESVFGDLFQLTANNNELFMSTATVNNVEIVTNFTGSNLRASGEIETASIGASSGSTGVRTDARSGGSSGSSGSGGSSGGY